MVGERIGRSAGRARPPSTVISSSVARTAAARVRRAMRASRPSGPASVDPRSQAGRCAFEHLGRVDDPLADRGARRRLAGEQQQLVGGRPTRARRSPGRPTDRVAPATPGRWVRHRAPRRHRRFRRGRSRAARSGRPAAAASATGRCMRTSPDVARARWTTGPRMRSLTGCSPEPM